ncbi:MAG TPA: hypothetical protein VES67_14295 [Vicinamibacterales bacterium]|nr:hypothetical protein [Vicinamibacterales bacterium]
MQTTAAIVFSIQTSLDMKSCGGYRPITQSALQIATPIGCFWRALRYYTALPCDARLVVQQKQHKNEV